jgi:hypothetical protein
MVIQTEVQRDLELKVSCAEFLTGWMPGEDPKLAPLTEVGAVSCIGEKLPMAEGCFCTMCPHLLHILAATVPWMKGSHHKEATHRSNSLLEDRKARAIPHTGRTTAELRRSLKIDSSQLMPLSLNCCLRLRCSPVSSIRLQAGELQRQSQSSPTSCPLISCSNAGSLHMWKV